MQDDSNLIRSLNHIEEAFTIMNAAHPLCAVIALHVKPAPDPITVKEAVANVQRKHHLLRAGIKKTGNKFIFFKLPENIPIPLLIHDDHALWKSVVEECLNTPIPESGPLMKIDLVPGKRQESATIIVSFHHSIIDGVSARIILDELLAAIGSPAEAESTPPISKLLPVFLRPTNLGKSLIKFLTGQISEEFKFRKDGYFSAPSPTSQNKIMSLRFSQSFTKSLKSVCVKHHLNLNNLILSSLTIATLRNKYPQKKTGRIRVVNFANVGSGLKPPITPENLGCYISMLRISMQYSSEDTVQTLARKIKQEIVKMGRSDTIRLMAWLSKYLVSLTLKLKTMRLGVSALSYIGNLELASTYGSYILADVNAYISNNKYGPEFSAFAKILHGQLGIDFNYLISETSEESAWQIVDEMQSLLSEISEID